MKKLILTTALLLCVSTPSFAETAFVDVKGLVCDFCARALEKVFGKQDAVEDINVNLDTKRITINFKDGQSLPDETIKSLIMDAGYNVDAIQRTEEKSSDE